MSVFLLKKILFWGELVDLLGHPSSCADRGGEIDHHGVGHLHPVQPVHVDALHTQRTTEGFPVLTHLCLSRSLLVSFIFLTFILYSLCIYILFILFSRPKYFSLFLKTT